MDRSSEIIQVDSRNVGRIIGARGSKINEIRDKSQAKIQIYEEEESYGKRSVEITGSQEQIEMAIMLIEQCATDDSRGGYGGAQRGRRDRRDDQWNQGRDSWRDRRNDNQDQWGGSSNTSANWRDRREYNDQGGRSRDFGDRRNDRSGGWGGKSNGSRDEWRNGSDQSDRRQGGFSRGFRENAESGNKENMYILSKEVGRLIGQGGSNIRELQNESDCRIKVSRDGSNGVNLVELFGSATQIDDAKALITKTFDTFDEHGSKQQSATDAQDQPW